MNVVNIPRVFLVCFRSLKLHISYRAVSLAYGIGCVLSVVVVFAFPEGFSGPLRVEFTGICSKKGEESGYSFIMLC